MRYVGSYLMSQDGNLRGPSTIVSNLRVEQTFSLKLRSTLDVLNVFSRQDKDIVCEQDDRVMPNSLVVPNGITVHPVEPRQCRLTLHYHF
ncbi:hypothetical protein [Undibacterium sp. SXout20W]|uniref:hypothetical protein n=1 Tax=Undibacterium sp. SXout20W TaxID=3413051 RepID=UPI003BF18C9E